MVNTRQAAAATSSGQTASRNVPLAASQAQTPRRRGRPPKARGPPTQAVTTNQSSTSHAAGTPITDAARVLLDNIEANRRVLEEEAEAVREEYGLNAPSTEPFDNDEQGDRGENGSNFSFSSGSAATCNVSDKLDTLYTELQAMRSDMDKMKRKLSSLGNNPSSRKRQRVACESEAESNEDDNEDWQSMQDMPYAQSSNYTGLKIPREVMSQRCEIPVYDFPNNFDEWWTTVLHLQQNYKWPDQVALEHARARIKGKAAVMYRANKLYDENIEFNEFHDRMRPLCPNSLDESTVELELLNATIQEGETVQQFAHRLTTFFNAQKTPSTEQQKISALLNGVCQNFDETNLQIAQERPTFALAVKYLTGVSGFRKRIDLKNASSASVASSLSQATSRTMQSAVPKSHFAPRNLTQGANTSSSSRAPKLFFCTKHGKFINHTTEQCTLQWCANHQSYVVHAQSECRATPQQLQSKRNVKRMHQASRARGASDSSAPPNDSKNLPASQQMA